MYTRNNSSLTELTQCYVNINFSPELQTTIYYSFMIQELFGIIDCEDKYFNLISREYSIDNDEKRDLFVKYLNNDINKIIKDHLIELNEEMEIRLYEKNEIAHFLYIIQNLETYDEFSYIVHAMHSPKIVLCSLIAKYSLLSLVRAMEIIGNVKHIFIEALKEYVKGKETISEEKYDREFNKHVELFLEFTKGTSSLGYRLYEQGYKNLTLQRLSDVLIFNIYEYVDKNILTEPTQTYLDVLSLLVITKDNYTMPLLKFKQNTALFTSNLENTTKVHTGMLGMIADFNDYLENQKKKEALVKIEA